VSRKESQRHGLIHHREACTEQDERGDRPGGLVPDVLVGAGISLIVIVGLIHLINSPGDLEEGAYTGVLYLANFVGTLASAVGIYWRKRWGWVLGFLVAGGAFAGYVISRTVGLPGLPVETEWLEPLGVLSLVVEALFVGVYLAILARPKEETRAIEVSS
jgi:uncharacterized membrane protein YfcA